MRAERAEALLAAAGIANPSDAIDCYRRSVRASTGPGFMPSTPPVSGSPTAQPPAMESPHENQSASLLNQRRVSVEASHQTHTSASDGPGNQYGGAVFRPSPLSVAYSGPDH